MTAGIAVIPAVGFDVVPSDCLAAMLAAALPTADNLQLAFTIGPISRGTAKTILETLPYGGRARLDGRIRWVPIAWKTIRVPFLDGKQWAVSSLGRRRQRLLFNGHPERRGLCSLAPEPDSPVAALAMVLSAVEIRVASQTASEHHRIARDGAVGRPARRRARGTVGPRF